MARYDYICPEGHTTERIVGLKATPPKTITCYETVITDDIKVCRKKAKKVEVYAAHVNGGPTRGAF